MLKKFIHFIKYHNGFTIGLMIIFMGTTATFAASPEVRSAAGQSLISAKETVRSIDNSGILAADLDNYNFSLQIKAVAEDEANYYVGYAYRTMGIEDYVWKNLTKNGNLVVSKQTIVGQDLGLYVAVQLGQTIDHELSYLKEVQVIEKGKGLTQKVATTEYSGLIGKYFSPQEKVFPGYEPVIEPVVEPAPESLAETASSTAETLTAIPTPEPAPAAANLDQEAIRQIVREMLAQEQANSVNNNVAAEPALTAEPAAPAEPIPAPTEPVAPEPAATSTPAEPVEPTPQDQPATPPAETPTVETPAPETPTVETPTTEIPTPETPVPETQAEQ